MCVSLSVCVCERERAQQGCTRIRAYDKKIKYFLLNLLQIQAFCNTTQLARGQEYCRRFNYATDSVGKKSKNWFLQPLKYPTIPFTTLSSSFYNTTAMCVVLLGQTIKYHIEFSLKPAKELFKICIFVLEFSLMFFFKPHSRLIMLQFQAQPHDFSIRHRVLLQLLNCVLLSLSFSLYFPQEEFLPAFCND